jgi:histo-blood group ABO system transferase
MKMKNIVLIAVVTVLQAHAAHVGLLIVATGKYINFVEPLIASANKHLLPGHQKTYFIFTDGQVPVMDNVVGVYQKRLGWPHDTLMRCSIYIAHTDLYATIDYLYALDADMLFVDTVGDEILGDRVATQHPGFVGLRGTYETNRCSTACVHGNEGSYYFAGGFHGGSRDEFLRLAGTMYHTIMRDLEHNFIAIWHDESHLNRYFIDNEPTVILNPSYCYPGNKRIAYPKKLVALDKNHAEYRK